MNEPFQPDYSKLDDERPPRKLFANEQIPIVKKSPHPFNSLQQSIDDHGNLEWLNKTVHELFSNRKLLAAVEKELDQLGFRKFSLIGEGSNAVAFNTTENQIVRIAVCTCDEVGFRPEHPAILHPIYRELISFGKGKNKREIAIDILPQVRTDGVTEKDKGELFEALKKSGYFVQDIFRDGNVGLIDIGGKTVPVLIDTGLIEHPTDVKDDKHLERWLKPRGSLADRSTWLQTEFEKRTTPSNVIDGATANRVEQTMRGKPSWINRVKNKIGLESHDNRHESQTMKAIKEDRSYISDVAKLYETAATIVEAKGDDYSFSSALREARDADKGNGQNGHNGHKK